MIICKECGIAHPAPSEIEAHEFYEECEKKAKENFVEKTNYRKANIKVCGNCEHFYPSLDDECDNVDYSKQGQCWLMDRKQELLLDFPTKEFDNYDYKGELMDKYSWGKDDFTVVYKIHPLNTCDFHEAGSNVGYEKGRDEFYDSVRY